MGITPGYVTELHDVWGWEWTGAFHGLLGGEGRGQPEGAQAGTGDVAGGPVGQLLCVGDLIMVKEQVQHVKIRHCGKVIWKKKKVIAGSSQTTLIISTPKTKLLFLMVASRLNEALLTFIFFLKIIQEFYILLFIVTFKNSLLNRLMVRIITSFLLLSLRLSWIWE